MLWAFTSAQWLTIGWTIATLVVLEGLLSADNALVLAMMVRHLPRPLQKRALRYGIWGAFVFRLIAVAFASVLLDFWIFEVVGGLYLGYLAVKHFLFTDHGGSPSQAHPHKAARGFWGTVVAVELTDIAFSIDSILAAVGLADGLPRAIKEEYFLIAPVELWVIYSGGVLGIITMRYVAGMFLRLLERFPGLADGAYLLVGWIGLKLVGMGLHHALHPSPGHAPPVWLNRVPDWVRSLPLEMPPPMFWTGMVLIVAGSLLIKRRPRSVPTEFVEAVVPASSSGDGGGDHPETGAFSAKSEGTPDRTV